MDLTGAIALHHEGRLIQAGAKTQEPKFKPVHAGAHAHFTKHRYISTGNKTRGGITTSNYFKRNTHGGNSREVEVHADGSYIKTSRTAKGMRRKKGRINANGVDAATATFKKGDWVQHPITKQRGRVSHVYSDNANDKGHLVEVKYGDQTVNHREANLTRSDNQAEPDVEGDR